jgi:hypothetical protein
MKKQNELRILSSKRGTSMHKFIEKHITRDGYEDLTEIGVQAKPMAQKIIDIGLTPVSEYTMVQKLCFTIQVFTQAQQI